MSHPRAAANNAENRFVGHVEVATAKPPGLPDLVLHVANYREDRDALYRV